MLVSSALQQGKVVAFDGTTPISIVIVDGVVLITQEGKRPKCAAYISNRIRKFDNITDRWKTAFRVQYTKEANGFKPQVHDLILGLDEDVTIHEGAVNYKASLNFGLFMGLHTVYIKTVYDCGRAYCSAIIDGAVYSASYGISDCANTAYGDLFALCANNGRSQINYFRIINAISPIVSYYHLGRKISLPSKVWERYVKTHTEFSSFDEFAAEASAAENDAPVRIAYQRAMAHLGESPEYAYLRSIAALSSYKI